MLYRRVTSQNYRGGGRGWGSTYSAHCTEDVIFTCKRDLITVTEVLANCTTKENNGIKLSLFRNDYMPRKINRLKPGKNLVSYLEIKQVYTNQKLFFYVSYIQLSAEKKIPFTLATKTLKRQVINLAKKKRGGVGEENYYMA